MKHLTSRDNPDYKALKKLAESSRERRKSGLILLDGMHLVQTYTQVRGAPQRIAVSVSGAARPEIAKWLACSEVSNVLLLDDALFNALTDVDTPSGILAVANYPQASSRLSSSEDTVVLDGVQDPGNLGSILRTAAAAGFRQAALSSDCAQAWAPRVLRAGMGAHFQIAIHEAVNLPGFLMGFQGKGIATALDGATDVFSLDLRGQVAWVFGSEGVGVRSDTLSAVSIRAKIPMPGNIESINVAAAAAVCLFETNRQRHL